MSTELYYLLFSVSIITFLSIASLYKDAEVYCKFFIWLIMTLFAGLRVGIGIDYPNYLSTYTDHLSHTFVTYEPFWQIFIKFYSYLSFPFHIWLLTIAGLTYYVFFRALKAWGVNWGLAVIAYILIYRGYFESLNTVRQTVAIVFVLWSLAHLYKKTYWKFTLLVLLGGLFHRSAFLCLPILPIINYSWSRRTLLVVLFSSLFIGMFFLKDFLFLFKGLMPSTYQVYLDDMSIWETEGATGIFHIFLNFVALGMLFFLYEGSDEENKRIPVLIRMVIGSIAIYNIFQNFAPAMRLMNYPFTAFFILIPIGVLSKNKLSIRLLSLFTLIGFSAFTIKDLSNPKEPFVYYQTILDSTNPEPHIELKRQELDLDSLQRN